ncbi:hypothetical protein D3C87_1299270 [compost metagenome]
MVFLRKILVLHDGGAQADITENVKKCNENHYHAHYAIFSRAEQARKHGINDQADDNTGIFGNCGNRYPRKKIFFQAHWLLSVMLVTDCLLNAHFECVVGKCVEIAPVSIFSRLF